jgi:hypothetical protein
VRKKNVEAPPEKRENVVPTATELYEVIFLLPSLVPPLSLGTFLVPCASTLPCPLSHNLSFSLPAIFRSPFS